LKPEDIDEGEDEETQLHLVSIDALAQNLKANKYNKVGGATSSLDL